MTIEAQGGAIQLYQDTGLVTLNPDALALPDIQARKRYFLPTDVLVSRYGIIGFVLLDSRPEQRRVTYTDADWAGSSTDEDSIPYESRGDRARRSHFLDTDTGFKMFRYFVMPEAVGEFFKRDKFLGEPFIDKCCRDGTLPEEFDEVPAATGLAFPHRKSENPEEDIDHLIDGIIEGVIDRPVTSNQRLYSVNHRIYLSFHAWENLKEVTAEGAKSIIAALGNFDSLLERFDTRRVLPNRLQPSSQSSNLPVINP